MESTLHLQGRDLTPQDILNLQAWMAAHPSWHRKRLSIELAKAWNWVAANGRLKDMAARTLLLKLHRRGYLALPPARRPPTHRRSVAPKDLDSQPMPSALEAPLHQIQPLSLELLSAKDPAYRKFCGGLARYHYLGYRGPVGETMAYQIQDRCGRDLACVLFGAAAWKVAPRDAWIGWTPERRAQGIQRIANNSRFLILPWVRVPHLASHVLGRISRRISADWQTKYGHPIELLETFVDRSRFRGICYRAANWRCVGQTQGRSRQDRYNQLRVPVKDIYLYPLNPDFRERLLNA